MAILTCLYFLNLAFSLRIGKYRAIFKIDKNIITILVLDIGSRGDIYKK